MTSVRIIKHAAIPRTGSYEVRFPDGRPSVYRYFDDNHGRGSITEKMTGAEALRAAKTLARAEQTSSIRSSRTDDLFVWEQWSYAL